MKISVPQAKVIGKATLLAVIQSVIATIEMSTRMSFVNYSKDQTSLQKAADNLSNYIILASFWTFGSSSVLYSNYGMTGFWWGIITNLAILSWNIFNYLSAFKRYSKEFGLKYPKLFDYSIKNIPNQLKNNIINL